MFAIYGVSGPIFQGTLEALSRMPPVMRRTPIASARRIEDDVTTEAATNGNEAAVARPSPPIRPCFRKASTVARSITPTRS